MDCFLTYNFSCVNSTFAQFNSSAGLFGHGGGDDRSTLDLLSSANRSLPASIFVSTQHVVITALILGAIIVFTIAGNILVIAAVKLEKNLHSVAYYLFVSLAVADLMIASLVMPIAILKEVTRSWVLGSIICDAWVMIDLLGCTASILHLVAIALDRYWAITNLDYANKRTPGRILILICIIWVTSILISSSHLFPIFRDKRGRPSDQCHLIGNVPYTILSTVGAFYIPLIGMCIIYWKIFQAAKFRIRRKGFSADRSPPPPVLTSTATPATVSTPSAQTDHPHDALLTSQSSSSNHQSSLTKKTKYESFSPSVFRKAGRKNSNNPSKDTETDNPSSFSSVTSQHTNNNDYQLKSLKKTSYSLLRNKQGSVVTIARPAVQFSASQRVPRDYEEEFNEINSIPSVSSTRRLITSSFNADSPVSVGPVNNPLSHSDCPSSTVSDVTDASSLKIVSTTVSTDVHHPRSHPNSTTYVAKSPALASRKKIDIKRERKATKVLGVVMGCFILCWLPFFLEETICGIFHLTIHEKVISVLTWLGYLNSLLNPVIYTIFAPDFRQAFGKILFGRYRKRKRRSKR